MPARTRLCLLAQPALLAVLATAPGCGTAISGVLSFGDGLFTISFTPPSTVLERSTEAVDFAGLRSLRVITRNGNIEVAVDPSATEVRVEVVKTATAAGQEAAAELVTQIEAPIARTGTTSDVLEIVARFPVDGSAALGGSGATQTGASFKITLAGGLALDLESENGFIDVADNVGDVRALTTNGRIRVVKQDGDADLETSNGPIEALDVAGNLIARTSNGSVAVRVAPPGGGSIDTETSNGRVTIEAPRGFAAFLDLATPNGSIALDFSGFNVDDLRQTRTSARATLNGGGGNIRGRTSNAAIEFRGF